MREEKTNHHKHHRGRRKKNSMLSTIVLIIAIIVFVVAGAMLIRIMLQYKAGDDEYKGVAKLGITIPKDKEQEDNYEKYWVDFDALGKQNSEIVAWIRFDQPEIISYPVVQADDNETYLNRAFGGTKNIYGTVFMDKDNDANFTNENTILYGHNMKSGAMFGSLKKYNEESYYKANPYFYVYTPDGKASKYQICSVRRVAADGDDYYMTFGDTQTYQKYIDTMFRKSYYNTGASVDTNSKLVTLSTCTSSDAERLLVQGVLIEQKGMVKE